MATATQNDDLLILDNDTNDNFILDEKPVIEEVNNTSDDLITFDDVKSDDMLEGGDLSSSDDNKKELDLSSNNASEETNIETLNLEDNLSTDNKEEDNKEKLDLETLDLGDLSMEENKDESNDILETENNIESNIEEENNIESNNFVTTLESSNDDVGTMVDILDGTIKKLEDRLLVNENETNNEIEHRDNLKKQISDLESQVNISEEKISELKSEKSLILKNTKAIEKMKSSTNSDYIKKETTKTSVKIHNVKRKQATAA